MSTATTGGERRRAPRKDASGKVSIRQLVRQEMGQERLLQAVVINLSKNGVLCRIDPATQVHSRVSLELELRGEEPGVIRCEGMVMRCDEAPGGHDTAVQITDFEGLDKERYEAVVAALPPV